MAYAANSFAEVENRLRSQTLRLVAVGQDIFRTEGFLKFIQTNSDKSVWIVNKCMEKL